MGDRVLDEPAAVVAHAVEPAGGVAADWLVRHEDYFFLPFALPLPLAPFAFAATLSASAQSRP